MVSELNAVFLYVREFIIGCNLPKQLTTSAGGKAVKRLGDGRNPKQIVSRQHAACAPTRGRDRPHASQVRMRHVVLSILCASIIRFTQTTRAANSVYNNMKKEGGNGLKVVAKPPGEEHRRKERQVERVNSNKRWDAREMCAAVVSLFGTRFPPRPHRTFVFTFKKRCRGPRKRRQIALAVLTDRKATCLLKALAS